MGNSNSKPNNGFWSFIGSCCAGAVASFAIGAICVVCAPVAFPAITTVAFWGGVGSAALASGVYGLKACHDDGYKNVHIGFVGKISPSLKTQKNRSHNVNQSRSSGNYRTESHVSNEVESHRSEKSTSLTKQTYVRKKRLGDLSTKYESNSSVETVSSGKHDAGGVSYGLYQLSSKTGTMKKFLESYEGQEFSLKYKYGDHTLDVNDIGSEKFNANYRTICEYHTTKMEDAQHEFIKQTHYKPLCRQIFDNVGITAHIITTNTGCKPLSEAIWSMSVQHGKAIKIFENVFHKIKQDMISLDESFRFINAKKLIRLLYKERETYALKYTHSKLHNGIKRRYQKEMEEILQQLRDDETVWYSHL